jgi:3(or 17)beta-hydroxysteroid dehydrogenase
LRRCSNTVRMRAIFAVINREKFTMDRVAGKVALVTGGASGMGKADAQLLAAEGAKVVVADLNEVDGKAVAEAIGNNAVFMRLNVADEDNWKAVVAATVEKFGSLDILVNNAGIIALGTIVDTTLASWRLVNSVNSDGVFLGCKHAIPAMAESGGGSIINMSSVAAIHGQSFVAAYSEQGSCARADQEHCYVLQGAKKRDSLQFCSPGWGENADGGESGHRQGDGNPGRYR